MVSLNSLLIYFSFMIFIPLFKCINKYILAISNIKPSLIFTTQKIQILSIYICTALLPVILRNITDSSLLQSLIIYTYMCGFYLKYGKFTIIHYIGLIIHFFIVTKTNEFFLIDLPCIFIIL